MGPTLGRGAFGVVRLVTHRSTGIPRAAKCISKSRLVSARDVEDVRREVQILHLLSPHSTIAGLVATYEDSAGVYMVIELCQGGELFDRIARKRNFSEADAARFFRRMAELVHHCHSCGVIHRDLKPENFLLTDTTDGSDLKACDFGLSTYYKAGQVFGSLVGSAYYVAPEVLRRQYGPECDVWSLGVILYILLCGVPPFYGTTEKDIFIGILRGIINFDIEPWPRISDAAKDLISRILVLNPKKRCTVEDILNHPWLHKHGVAPTRPLGSLVGDRLRRFSGMTRLRKALVQAGARHLSHESIQGLRELFRSYDVNGDGVVTLDELKAGLEQSSGGKALFGHLEDDISVEKLWKEADLDGSGAIDYEEWLAATVNLSLLEREDVLARLFQEMDKDGNGTLCSEEIAASLSQMQPPLSEEEIHNAIAAADTNGDGVIDFREFVEAWRAERKTALTKASSSLRFRLQDTFTAMEIDGEIVM